MSEDNTDYDYALALQLYHDLNGAPFEASPEEFAVTAESDSDEEEKDKKNILSANLALDQGKDTMSGSRTAMNSSTVTFDNQQAITVSLTTNSSYNLSHTPHSRSNHSDRPKATTSCQSSTPSSTCQATKSGKRSTLL